MLNTSQENLSVGTWSTVVFQATLSCFWRQFSQSRDLLVIIFALQRTH